MAGRITNSSTAANSHPAGGSGARGSENAHLKSSQIGAESLHDANLLAVEVVVGLSREVIGAISVAGGGQGVGFEVVDVYEEVYDDTALRLWCREELLSSNLEAHSSAPPLRTSQHDGQCRS